MNTRFRGSRTARGIATVVLGLFVLGYLVGITYWRLEDLSVRGSLALLSALWAIGIVALVLLARAWRHR
jgi:uncharacterized membrane protein YhaH (DUF805 family)